jgi:hypothetical protein
MLIPHNKPKEEEISFVTKQDMFKDDCLLGCCAV